MSVIPTRRSMQSVVAIRLTAVVVCTVGQIVADAPALGLGVTTLFVSSTLFFGMIGLKWPQLRPLLRNGSMGAKLYSCGGAVWGCLGGAVAVLALVGRLALWESTCVPFVIASIGYYLAGKLSCVELRCCESAAPIAGLRLPALEVMVCAAIVTAGVALAALHISPLTVLATVGYAFGSLRVLSRLKRGHGLARSLASVDVGGVLAIAIFATLGFGHIAS